MSLNKHNLFSVRQENKKTLFSICYSYATSIRFEDEDDVFNMIHMIEKIDDAYTAQHGHRTIVVNKLISELFQNNNALYEKYRLLF